MIAFIALILTWFHFLAGKMVPSSLTPHPILWHLWEKTFKKCQNAAWQCEEWWKKCMKQPWKPQGLRKRCSGCQTLDSSAACGIAHAGGGISLQSMGYHARTDLCAGAGGAGAVQRNCSSWRAHCYELAPTHGIFYFILSLLLFWWGKVQEWLGGNLVASNNQPTTISEFCWSVVKNYSTAECHQGGLDSVFSQFIKSVYPELIAPMGINCVLPVENRNLERSNLLKNVAFVEILMKIFLFFWKYIKPQRE